ncbi:MAG: hypothetical protein RL153_1768, partial [Verrucomicrobiota bacterium]
MALFIACLMAGWARAASTNLLWRWSNPLPFGANITDLAVRSGEPIVAVAEHGQAYESDDLASWYALDTGTSLWLRSATYFGTTATNTARFLVIAAQSGTLLVSQDRTTFTRVSLGTTDWIESVAASPSLLVAVGDNGAVYTSGDATNWVRRASAAIGSTWLRGVTWRTNGVFCAVGEGGLVATSANGINWTRQTSRTTAALNRVTPLPAGFAAVGDGGAVIVDTSGSGANWRVLSSGATNDLYAVQLEYRSDFPLNPAGALLVAGDGELRSGVVSLNLWSDETDSRRTAPAPKATYLAGYWNATNAIFAGRAGIIAQGTRPFPTAGFNWSLLDSPPRSWLFSAATNTAYGTNTIAVFTNNAVALRTTRTTNRFAVAVGDGPTILQSDRGITWSTALLPTNASGQVILGVAALPDQLVAVGSGGVILRSPVLYEPIVSTNVFTNSLGAPVRVVLTNLVNTMGLAWYNAAKPVTNVLQGIAATPQRMVAAGSAGVLLVSTNATNWSRVASPTAAFLTSVEAGPSAWVASGDQGTLLSSPDGLAWTRRTSGTTQWLWRTRWAGSQFVAVGYNGTLLTSPDAITWTPRASGVTNHLHDVVFVDDTWYAVGGQGTVLGSRDAVTWSRLGTLTSKSLQSVVHLDGRLLAMGADGSILRAVVRPFPDPVALAQWPHQPSESVFLATGEPGQWFRLDRSTNLLEWTAGPLLEIPEDALSLLFVDSTTNAPALQLYLARQAAP